MKAMIIGGGIGGPVAAMALQRAGIDAVVYEAEDGPAEARGLFLSLALNGLRVLRELDVLEAVMRANTISTPVMAFSSWTGKSLGTVPNGWLDSNAPSITLMRGALQRALTDQARSRGVAIRYGSRLVAYGETGTGVTARFQDGSEAHADILIGADGIRSRVRAVMDPGAPAPSYTGLLNLGGVAQGLALPATPETMHMIWGRRAFFGYTIRPDGEGWWFANVGSTHEPSREELASVSTTDWKQRLHGLFAGDPALITTLIDRTERIDAFPIHDMPSLPRWHGNRVALLGDAAHAVSPSAGQGASLAMEDALMLAKCLRDVGAPQLAFTRYESLRRDRAERIVAAGRRRGQYKALQNRAAVFLRDLVMPFAFRLFATKRALAWIYDYDVAWNEPVQRSRTARGPTEPAIHSPARH